MIINTGARTDTVQYYTEWLLGRFREGYAFTRNPVAPLKVTRYELTPDKVDCVVFCSKNYRPILKDLHEITDRFNTYFQYTITAYGKDMEPGVPSIDESIETLYELEKQVGKQRICWRYDPVFLLGEYTIKKHLETFRYMTEKLAGHVDRCVFSFVELYRYLNHFMPELFPVSENDKNEIAKGLGSIAREFGMKICTCGTNGDYTRYGIGKSGCITSEILGRANGVEFRKVRQNGQREGCHCIENHDIGDYNSCPNGCRYCYANIDRKHVMDNYRKHHDPKSPILLYNISDNDTIVQGSQESYLVRPKDPRQTTLDY